MSQEAYNPALLQILVLERVDRVRNMARYYILSIEPTLFEDFAHARAKKGAVGRPLQDFNGASAPSQLVNQAGDRDPSPSIRC
jgi:hypothetical protein